MNTDTTPMQIVPCANGAEFRFTYRHMSGRDERSGFACATCAERLEVDAERYGLSLSLHRITIERECDFRVRREDPKANTTSSQEASCQV